MKLALFHNVGPGGAKRALYEHVRGLTALGHTVDLFHPASACETYLPLAPLCRAVKVYGEAGPGGGAASSGSGGEGAVRRLARRVLGDAGHDVLRDYFWLRKVERGIEEQARLQEMMATDILAGSYDVLYAHQCGAMLAPDLLRHVAGKLPTVFYVQDTLRRIEEWTPGPLPTGYDKQSDTLLQRKRRGRILSPVMLSRMQREEARFVRNLRSAETVLVNSRYSREGILRTTGVGALVNYLGVDSDYFTPSSEPREHEVVSVGAMRPEKRHDLVIEAAGMLPQALRPRVRIVGYELPGADALGTQLCELARSLKVELILEREVTDAAVRDAYRRAKVVAFTPYLESFGLVPLEAMACETPVVAVAEGGPRETTREGVTGYLADTDPAAFGAALGRLLEDETRRQEMGRAGREWVCTDWTWERSVREVEGILQSAAVPW
jgi:glycosyltransferase involved in cell wall biosynthesis